MAQYNLTLEQKGLSTDTYKDFNAEDKGLLESFVLNSSFKPSKHFIELHIYSLGNNLLRSITSYDNYSIQGGEDTAEGSSDLYIDPEADSKAFGYSNGGIQLQYILLNNLFAEGKFNAKLFIKEISNDRTELKLDSLGITPEDLQKFSLSLKDEINNNSSFSGFRLNLGNNILCIGLNIDYLEDENCVAVKLYEPLLAGYEVKDTLDIVEYVSAPIVYEIDSEFIPDEPTVPRLREANFNIDIDENTSTPSQYFNFDELFSFKVENKNYQLLSLFNEKGAEISIDHSDYSDFIHFSSAEERLINFKYKLDLIKNYESSIANVSSDLGSSGITNNTQYYEDLLKGVVDNFDHYERFLYFESGSYSWPKSNSTKPYENQASTTTEAITWFDNQRTTANNFDVSNFNILTNTIPTFIREDDNNAPYVLFVQMLGQHFDNLYIYAKAVSDKYDADNRINVGVSRDLVEEAIKSLGVKLYNSSKSLENLFKLFIDESAADTSEVINPDNQIEAAIAVSGGTIVEGPNQGFEANYENLATTVYYPQFSSIYSGMLFAFSTNSPSFSYGYDNDYFYENTGGEIFLTITDSTDTQHGPFKYIIAQNLNHTNITSGRISRHPNPNAPFIFAHPIDANGQDNSTLFTNLHAVPGVTDMKLKDSAVTTVPLVTKPLENISQDIYQKSIYKRIYHNLPFLLKTKGTQRGLRALINCFGIPSSILDIKTYGGRKTSEKPFFGDSQYYKTSADKVRTDNTGSIVEGDTLSRFTSIVKTDNTYNQDLHNVEVGFSPSDNLDKLITSVLGDTFNIDDYIGDPRDLTLDKYNNLLSITKTALDDVTSRYDIKDFVRLIKFFDNVVFKMIKDFLPARSTVDTGIIIKPHLLDKSKAKSVNLSATQPEYSGSIDTAFMTGSNPGAYQSSASGSLRFDSTSAKLRANTLIGTKGESSTRSINEFRRIGKTPLNAQKIKQYASYTDHGQDEAKFDGELANSIIRVSTGELNDENTLKRIKYPNINYDVVFFKDVPSTICAAEDNPDVLIIGRKTDAPFTGQEDKIINIYPTLFNVNNGGNIYYGPYPLVEELEFDSNNQPTNLETAVKVQDSGHGTANTIKILANDLTTFAQYQTFEITSYNAALQSGNTGLALYPSCATRREFKVVRCRLETKETAPSNPVPGTIVDVTDWFSGIDVNTQVTYFVDGNEISTPTSYTIQEGNTVFTVKDNHDQENCFATLTVNVEGCGVDGVEKGEINLDGVYDIPSFFFGFTPQENQPEYSIKLFDPQGNPFHYQDLQYYLDNSQSGYYLADENDTWIVVPQNGVDETQFPADAQAALLEIFDTLDFEPPQEPGFSSIGTFSQALFRVRLLEVGTSCKHETSEFSDFEIEEKKLPEAQVIGLVGGSLCEACQATRGGSNVEGYYMSPEPLGLNSIVENKIRLYKTEQAAINADLREQIDSKRYGDQERQETFLIPNITYYYDARDERENNPWHGSQQAPLECTRKRLELCRD